MFRILAFGDSGLPETDTHILREEASAGGRETGFTMVEILVVIVAIGILFSMTMPSFYEMYRQHQLRGAATTVSMLIRFAKLQAVKEKTRYKVVFSDENAGGNANRASLQFESGGSFGDVSGQQHDLDEHIKILGGGGYDSMDDLTVSRRGECTAGTVYLEGHGGAMVTVTIATTCSISYS